MADAAAHACVFRSYVHADSDGTRAPVPMATRSARSSGCVRRDGVTSVRPTGCCPFDVACCPFDQGESERALGTVVSTTAAMSAGCTRSSSSEGQASKTRVRIRTLRHENPLCGVQCKDRACRGVDDARLEYPVRVAFLDHLVRFYRRGRLVIITDNISTRTGVNARAWLSHHP